jgi:hypothetical protein
MLATPSGPRDTEPMIMAPNVDDYYRLVLEKLMAEVQQTPEQMPARSLPLVGRRPE